MNITSGVCYCAHCPNVFFLWLLNVLQSTGKLLLEENIEIVVNTTVEVAATFLMSNNKPQYKQVNKQLYTIRPTTAQY